MKGVAEGQRGRVALAETGFTGYMTTELGETMHHHTELDLMKSQGPSTDEALLSKTELYYFPFSGLPSFCEKHFVPSVMENPANLGTHYLIHTPNK